MVQPHGFKSSTHATIFYQLKKPLYDLKQAPRAWHSKITQYLHQIGFKMSESDNSLFIRSDSRGKLLIIIYADDLVIGGENIGDIKHIKNLFSGRFMKELHYFLGIEIIRTPSSIMISQQHYILNLLFKFGITMCKPEAQKSVSRFSIVK